ncbi:sensor histidine kinase [Peredibacter starrii]|uniref:histidine kinase n=1 Tax=Peredibacter starrii TaxID=28202 RepID=A0AAX4HL94_9BACT|nr:HAMP domain-containing sensor histidine kinase [Peredibacter starrii]WPU64034.1 HAMP domain-containing sensor histidine kinase [Peredibacter starrii]
MDVNKTRRWFYGLTLLWVFMLLGLGSWWLFLVFKLHSTMSELNLPELGSQSRFLNMMRWEGTFFFIFLVLLGGSLFLMYFRDMKKSKAMQAFFSSLSHELKTPLASMRLQAEVIKDMIEDETHDHDTLSNLTKRLIEDTHKLESELEKSLQLSRIEQDAPLTLVPVSIERFIKRQEQKLQSPLKVELKMDMDAREVMADELALNLIFRNLFENTLRHNKDTKQVSIACRKHGPCVEITYDDHGKKFTGDMNLLGSLFYKFESSKGSGIGLYLIKNLMRKMQGQLEILNADRLKFRLTFLAPTGETDV